MLKLIGMLDSPFVRRVAIALHLYDIPFEHLPISVFRHREQMQKLNPTLKVPLLMLDDGTRLLDSNLILDYVDRQVSSEQRLWPEGEARWQAMEVAGLALVVCEKAVQLYYEHILRAAELRSADWAQRCKEQMHAALAQLEAHPALDLMSGKSPGHAQIAVAVALGFIRHVQPKLTAPLLEVGNYPRLDQLSIGCENLDAFRLTPLA